MNIDDMLKFDALAEAEKITGESYKDDEATSGLGLLIHMEHGARKRDALIATGDTYWSMLFDQAMMVFNNLGFEVVYEERFGGRRETEKYIIWWHPKGILGTLESYGGSTVNTANIYYNWVPNEGVHRWDLTSSGHMAKRTDVDIWVGNHDVREGLRHKFNALKDNGTFINPWDERPFLWLLDYSETKTDDYDYQAINAGKISMLPPEVIGAITPDDVL